MRERAKASCGPREEAVQFDRRGDRTMDARCSSRSRRDTLGVHILTGSVYAAVPRSGDVIELRIIDVSRLDPAPIQNIGKALSRGAPGGRWWASLQGCCLPKPSPRSRTSTTSSHRRSVMGKAVYKFKLDAARTIIRCVVH